MATEARKIKIVHLAPESATQVRVFLDEKAVADYAEAIRADQEFPPIDVFDDGETLWVGDGFHRIAAHRKAGRDTIEAIVHKGDRWAAIQCQCSKNATHGVRLTNADKRRAVELHLRDPDKAKFSDRVLAECIGVSGPTVASVRAEVQKFCTSAAPEERVGADGKTYRVPKTSPPPPREDPKPEPRAKPKTAPPPSRTASKPEPAPEPPPEPEPVIDDAGRQVTDEKVLEALSHADEFRELVNAAHGCKRDIIALARTELGAELRAQQIERDFRNIVKAVEFAVPFTTCPYMPNCPRGCATCNKKRWVTREQWERIPEEDRK